MQEKNEWHYSNVNNNAKFINFCCGNKAVTGEQVAELFRKSGIKRLVDDVDHIQRMIQNADVIISAWHEDKLDAGHYNGRVENNA